MKSMQIKKIVAIGALLLSASVLSLPAVSQPGQGSCGDGAGSGHMGGGHKGKRGGGHTEMMGGRHMDMMAGHKGFMKKFMKLGLSEEQEERIREIKHELHKRHWTIMGPMIDVKEELRKAHSADRPDPKAIGAIYSKMFDLQRQMIEARIEAKNQAKDLLTEEQVAQMKAMKKKRRHKMHGQGGMKQGQGGMKQGQGGMKQGQGGAMQGQSSQTN